MPNTSETIARNFSALMFDRMQVDHSRRTFENVEDFINAAQHALSSDPWVGGTEFRCDLVKLILDLKQCQSWDGAAVRLVSFLEGWCAWRPVIAASKPETPITEMKFDDDKLDYSLIEPRVTAWLAAVLTYGVTKYKRESWRELRDWRNRYYSATLRHIEKWRAGEEFDPDSDNQLHHLACALFSVACLLALSCTAPISEIQTRTQAAIKHWRKQNEKNP